MPPKSPPATTFENCSVTPSPAAHTIGTGAAAVPSTSWPEFQDPTLTLEAKETYDKGLELWRMKKYAEAMTQLEHTISNLAFPGHKMHSHLAWHYADAAIHIGQYANGYRVLNSLIEILKRRLPTRSSEYPSNQISLDGPAISPREVELLICEAELKLAGLLNARGNYTNMVPLLDSVVVKLAKLLGPNARNTLYAKIWLAIGYIQRTVIYAYEADKQDCVIKQISLLKEVVEVYKHTLKVSDTDRDLLLAQDTLASAYAFLGRHAEQRELLIEVVKMKRQFEPTKRLTSLRNLALAHRELSEFNEALVLLKEVLDIQNENYGPDHYEIVATHRAIAPMYIGLAENALKIGDRNLYNQHLRDSLKHLNKAIDILQKSSSDTKGSVIESVQKRRAPVQEKLSAETHCELAEKALTSGDQRLHIYHLNRSIECWRETISLLNKSPRDKVAAEIMSLNQNITKVNERISDMVRRIPSLLLSSPYGSEHSLFSHIHSDDYLKKNKASNPVLQHLFDQRFGLIVVSRPEVIAPGESEDALTSYKP